MIISVLDITKAYGDTVVLDNISFLIEEGEKAAVVGVNGAGKTTLFKIIAGIIPADKGRVILSKNAQAAYLEQNISYNSDLTIYQEMMTAFIDIINAENKMREMEVLMGGVTGEVYDKLLSEYNEVSHYYEENGGYSYKSLVRGVIAGLGLDGADIADKRINTLSGGQKTRVKLGVTLLKKPDILMLDEPTNHLDIESVNWLEGYLKGYDKTVMIISHDRYFLDSVATKIIDIEHNKSKVYTSAYSQFIERKRMDFDILEKQYKDQRKEIKKQEEAIKLLKSYNRQKTVKRAESKEKQLAKIMKIDKPKGTPENMRIKLVPKIESGYDVLTVSGLAKSFGSNKLFSDISFEIKRGEKVALIGANGVGKTTLLKIIINELLQDLGTVRAGANVKIGYYDQERQNLDNGLTIIGHIQNKYPNMNDSEIRNVLAAFLFKGDDILKPVDALSGGERGRLCLSLVMLNGANFLILDEPTNHLDMYSKEILEDALSAFKGTMLYVSHDRYFINKTATRVLELTNDGITSYLGNYDYYLKKKAEIEYYRDNTVENGDTAKNGVQHHKTDWHERKAEISEQRKRANKLLKIEALIAETEEKIDRLNALMCKEEVFTNAEKAKEVHDLKVCLEDELEKLYMEWEATDEPGADSTGVMRQV